MGQPQVGKLPQKGRHDHPPPTAVVRLTRFRYITHFKGVPSWKALFKMVVHSQGEPGLGWVGAADSIRFVGSVQHS